VVEAFLIKPFLALILITISCSLLGIFVLWKKLAYFGDGLSHSILLGFVLGAICGSNQATTIIIFAVFYAMLIELISLSRSFSKDTIIAISSYFCIASAIILNDLWQRSFDLGSYVFGDILTVTNTDINFLAAIAIITIFYTIFGFRKTLLISINKDLAKIEGFKIKLWNLSFTVLLAVTVALSVKIVGIFLMTALLVLPAAIARIFSISAKQMILLSLVIGICVTSFAFDLASKFDLTISALIIATFCLIFIFTLVLKKISLHAKS